MALRLAQAFNTTPELWLNLQRAYDLWEAAHHSEAWREVAMLVEA
jgi:addiction module HigA family antidote